MPLPPRFAELKRTVIGDEANQRRLVAGWGRLTKRLAEVAQEIEEKQQDVSVISAYWHYFVIYLTKGITRSFLKQRIMSSSMVEVKTLPLVSKIAVQLSFEKW